MPGFTLPEVLLATLISMVVSGALFLVAQPAQAVFRAQLEVTDLQQRLRAAVGTIAGDLAMAGAGPAAGPGRGPLTGREAPVLPYRHGALADDPRANVFYRPDTITLRYVAAATQSAVDSHTYYLRPDAAANAFQLMHYDGAGGDFPMIDNVVRLAFEYFGDSRPPTSIAPPPPGTDFDLRDEYGPGENCLFRTTDDAPVPRLPPLAAAPGLVRLDAPILVDGPWCPNSASDSRFDADLLRIRRVSVRLRLQVGQVSLRGAAGPLFLRGGVATASAQLVPDMEIRFDVAPRNLNVDR